MSLLTERLLKASHEEDCCCEECCCEEHEHNHKEENLSEEEIERIINEKYSEKDEKTKEFIRRGLRKFGDRFDYNKTVYKNAHEKVIITCPKHKLDFEEVANEHYRPNYAANPCPVCAHEVRHEIMVRRNKEGIPKTKRTLVSLLEELRGLGLEEIYDLSYITEYKNAITPVILVKRDCGHEFKISIRHLMEGYTDCPICSRERGIEKRRMGFEGFKEKANVVHPNDRYFYDFDENKVLLNNRQKVKIRCNHCGNIFWQEVSSHLSGSGCPKCVLSRGEEIVDSYLKERDIFTLERECIYGVSSVRDYIIPDFRILLESKEVWIEYNGIQHYKATFNFGDKSYAEERLLNQIARDKDVREYCKEHNIFLVEIPYTLSKMDEVYDFLDKVLFENIDPHTLIDYDALYIVEDNNST